MNGRSVMTVKEVSKITGLSVRTLHYYDNIGLLSPSRFTEAGYRLCDEKALEKLQQIMLFRELEFSLKEIKIIMSDSKFDSQKAVEQQIELLKLRRDHLDNLISFAIKIKESGVDIMRRNNKDFSAFDKSKLEEYSKRAKAQWGDTKEYMEFEKKKRDEQLSKVI